MTYPSWGFTGCHTHKSLRALREMAHATALPCISTGSCSSRQNRVSDWKIIMPLKLFTVANLRFQLS